MVDRQLSELATKELIISENRFALKKKSIQYIQDIFDLKTSVKELHNMTKSVCEKGYDHDSVNAACNCIGRLNDLINTTIKASDYLINTKK